MEILKVNKKIKIHIKNNHGRSGTFPCDLEGEKNFTITKKHIQKALENEPKIRKQVEFFIDWDEDNFNSSMSSSEILLTYDFPTKNLKAIAPNLKCFTPGIRQDENKNDQKRTMNAKQALEAGSDCLIIGRPITKGNIKKNISSLIDHLNQ